MTVHGDDEIRAGLGRIAGVPKGLCRGLATVGRTQRSSATRQRPCSNLSAGHSPSPLLTVYPLGGVEWRHPTPDALRPGGHHQRRHVGTVHLLFAIAEYLFRHGGGCHAVRLSRHWPVTQRIVALVCGVMVRSARWTPGQMFKRALSANVQASRSIWSGTALAAVQQGWRRQHR